MLYNMLPNPYQCIKAIIRRLRRRLWGVCYCAPTLPENLKSKNENKKSGYMIRHVPGFVFRFMVFVLSV